MSQILPGQVFGRLTAIEFAGYRRTSPSSGKRGFWLCACECGNRNEFKSKYLLNGDTKSCGCLVGDRCADRNRTHGMANTPTYISWAMMVNRCTNKGGKVYKHYGAKGITVCPEWMTFDNFLADMGVRPDGTTLDRREVLKGYFKDNCRWANDHEQAQNRGVTKLTRFGIPGVTWRDDFQRYSAHIGAFGKHYHLGLYQDFFEACCARKSAENRLWLDDENLI